MMCQTTYSNNSRAEFTSLGSNLTPHFFNLIFEFNEGNLF